MRRRTVLFTLVALFLAAPLVEAQTEMRFYLLPKIGDGLSVATAFRPKYVSGGGIAGTYTSMDYGAEDLMLVAANVTPAEHTAIAANVDVLAVPANLDANVSALALTTIQDELEAANLPADWVTTELTYRQVLKGVATLVLINQRYQGLFGRLFTTGITLDLRWNELTVQMRANLKAVADSFMPPLDTSAVTNTTTLRHMLKIVADQLPPVVLGGETF